MQRSFALVFCVSFLGSTAVGQWSGGASNQGGFPNVVAPAGNPITQDKVLLGKALFWDEQLSSSRMTACGTCHEPRSGMADGRAHVLGARSLHPGPDGVRGTADDKIGARGPVHRNTAGRYEPDALFGLDPVVGTRRAPTTINAAFMTNLFWDGRVTSGTFRDPVTNTTVLTSGAMLENLVIQPLVNDLEMAHTGRTWVDVVQRIQGSTPLQLSPQLSPDLQSWLQGRSYAQLYQAAFGSPVIDASRTIMAIATYMRTLVSNQSAFDRFRAGDTTAMTPVEQQGLNLFRAHRCNACHFEGTFTDNAFHNTGVRPIGEDGGRANGEFRTPSLRNVSLRAPFFHNGGMQTLEQVVDFYIRGGDFPSTGSPAGGPPIVPLAMSVSDRDAVVAFLKALTDPRVAAETAPFDRPALGATRAPLSMGTATAGSAGTLPRMIAFEPMAAGNPDFTLALDDGLGGSLAFLLASPAWIPPAGVRIADAQIYVDFTHPAAMLVPAGMLQGAGAGQGWTSLSMTVPENTTLVGLSWCFQWLVGDPGATSGLAASEMAIAQIY